MRVVDAYPPNIEKICAHFPLAGRKGVIFTYGDVIYAPHGVKVIPAIKAHELAHSRRQEAFGGPEYWWDRYIADVAFRYAEELLGHQAEYRWFRNNRPGFQAREALMRAAERLASPLYGNLVSVAEAKLAIEQQSIVGAQGRAA